MLKLRPKAAERRLLRRARKTEPAKGGLLPSVPHRLIVEKLSRRRDWQQQRDEEERRAELRRFQRQAALRAGLDQPNLAHHDCPPRPSPAINVKHPAGEIRPTRPEGSSLS